MKTYKLKLWNQIKGIKSVEVEEKSLNKEGFKYFLHQLKHSCIVHDGVGLAAPQVGIFKRVIICNFNLSQAEEDFKILINPHYVPKSEDKTTQTEYCLSVPTGYPISRWNKIEASYIEFKNNMFENITIELEGMKARLLQHEYDHLDGISIPQRWENQSKKQ